MMRFLFVVAGILFLSFNTDASFNDKTASDITGTHRMTAIDFRIAVNKLTLGEFNNFDLNKQKAIRERAQKAGLELPFEASIDKTPSKKTGIQSEQMPQKIIPKLTSDTPENNTNIPKEKSVSDNTYNNQSSYEKALEKFHEKYETLNHIAPIWVQQMDEYLNKISSLMNDVAKAIVRDIFHISLKKLL